LAMLGRPRVVVAQAGASVASPTTTELERYTGLFRGSNPEMLAKFVVRNGQLVAVLPGNRPVTPSGADRFRAGASELVFRMGDGKVKDLVQINGADSTIFVPLPSAAPSAKELASYAGRYWSDELDTRLSVEVRDTVLVLKRRPADEIILRPTFRDGFSAQGLGSLVFSRHKNGKISGFGIWAGRVRDVKFAKEK
ncbi:MAG: hypothetical protein ABI969_17820, partial [bacterium]